MENDITILMATDPEKLTRSDIDAIIQEMRAKRASFNAGNLRAGSTKAPKVKKDIAELAKTLGDIKL